MGEKPTPKVLTHIFRDTNPGRTAQIAIAMSGNRKLHLPTEMLVAISIDCFGVNPEPHEEQTHRERYKDAKEIGKSMFANPHEIEEFARKLLLPEFLVKDFINEKSLPIEKPSLKDITDLALEAEVPVLIVLQRLNDIRNYGHSPKNLFAGISDKNDYGFTYTNRGKGSNSPVLRRLAETVQQLPLGKTSVPFFASRTDYSGNREYFPITLQDKVGFKRPNGENEFLMQFTLGRKIGKYTQETQNPFVIEVPIINIDAV